MTQSRVNIKVVIETADKSGQITKIEEWDIITACVIATRAAIEEYVAPSQQQAAMEACARVMSAPLPIAVEHASYTIRSPFGEDDR